MTTILAFLLYSSVLLLAELTREPIELSQRVCEKPSEQVCPNFGSKRLIKNGLVHNGNPKCQYKSCGSQFIFNHTKTTVSQQIEQLIYGLLLQRVALRVIARLTQLIYSWLQDYVNQNLARTPYQVKGSGELQGKLIIECDETWSFVDSHKNEVYIWLSINRNFRKVVSCFVEDGTINQPVNYGLVYQRFISGLTRAYTDFWQSYKTFFPHNSYRAVGKEAGLTNHIERLNNTFRQRVSRLVRESLSFSKKLNNHIGAVWYFIHGYNIELDRT